MMVDTLHRKAHLIWQLVYCLAVLPAAGGLCQEPPQLPKYGPHAVRLFEDRVYLQQQPAADFWALIPYYAAQPDDRSCSAASVAMLVNALRAARPLAADEPLATCESVVVGVPPRQWRDKLAVGGPGVTLDELAEILPAVLRGYGLTAARVEVKRFAGDAISAREELHEMLTVNERSARDLIIVNYLQSVLTGDPEGAVGHLAPVGAYDAPRRRVLLLDPDRKWYEPYWVPLDKLLAAMATPDSVSGRARGLIQVVARE